MINQFYFPNINVAYSSIPKCACSTIKKTLLYAEIGELTILDTHPGKVHELVKDYKVDSDKALSGVINLVVVREPVERLLSAFLDKFCTAYHNPEAFVLRFIEEHNLELETFSFYEFLNILNLSYKDSHNALNEHWDDQFKFIESFKDYQIKIDFSDLKEMESIKYENLEIPIKTIDVHATPKSKVYVESAQTLGAKQLLEYRKKNNAFPSVDSFLSELEISECFPNIVKQKIKYKKFLSSN